ncbi:MAG: hypothetical protein NTY55_01045 [Flavobacteriia bacterium]|nr:hypothetical protein [Flavobacteriia bacterium]
MKLFIKYIQAVTNLIRGINSEIGYYKEQYFTETGFAVKLSNGAINMSVEVAQDYEAQTSSVTPERIQSVADIYLEKYK